MKVVVISEYHMIRQGIISLISNQDDIQLCGEAATYNEALDLLKDVRPDIALVDISINNGKGLGLISKAKEKQLSIKYIIIELYGSSEYIFQSLRLGVEGYILGEAYPEEILYAMRHVYKGGKYYASDVIDHLIHSNNRKEIPELTERETQVLEALGKGLSNRQIAKNFYITENTVKKHVSQILYKLELGDRTQAAIFANNMGLSG